MAQGRQRVGMPGRPKVVKEVERCAGCASDDKAQGCTKLQAKEDRGCDQDRPKQVAIGQRVGGTQRR